MKAMGDFDRRAAAWLADGPSELNDRVLEAALHEVHLTKQRRAMRVPWRVPNMPAFARATGLAAVVLVAIVGAGGLIYLNLGPPAGPGAPTSTPAATEGPTAGPTDARQGITWMAYTSEVYGTTLGYPEGWTRTAATRPWQDGDAFPVDGLPYADAFVSPGAGDDQIALIVWTIPPVDGEEIDEPLLLRAWADRFCQLIEWATCDGFTDEAVPLQQVNGTAYASAILVPTPEAQFAFITDCMSCVLVGATNPGITVVVVARPDAFPAAIPFGGSLALLKSVLTTMDVWMPGQQTLPAGWITRLATSN